MPKKLGGKGKEGYSGYTESGISGKEKSGLSENFDEKTREIFEILRTEKERGVEEMYKKRKDIGVNKIGNSVLSARSSFDGLFTDEDIYIQSGLRDQIKAKIGDIKDAYLLLNEKVKDIDINNISDIAGAILDTVDEYFGGLKNTDKRLSYYFEGAITPKNNKISNLKGGAAAMCVERAALSQNLLQSLGIKSFYKTSQIIKNGNYEIHSYNLVEHNGKYYIFDSTMPNKVDSKPNPLIAEIDKDSFELITSPLPKIGTSITVSHYNPYQNSVYTVTYDCGRERQLEVLAYGQNK